jgi:hydroxyacylglutathione hydrolase
VFPAHGAGSACGRAISAATSSTIGAQRLSNRALRYDDETQFVAAVTASQPPAPSYFSFDARRNMQRRILLDEQAPPRPITFAELATPRFADAVVLDAREPAEFAVAHLRGSLNVGLEGRFAEYAGSVISPQRPIVLITPTGRELEARIRLGRIGFDNVVGLLTDAPTVLPRHAVTRTHRLTKAELRHRLDTKDNMALLDVRNPGEVADGRIDRAVNIPLSRLAERLGELDRNRAVVIYCASGNRSMTAASVLSAAGFSDVSDVLGGYSDWVA